MKYKVGDKVRVRKDLKVNSRYYSADKKHSDVAVDEMVKLAGKTVTVEKTYNKIGKYSIKEANYVWTDEMFEDIYKFKVGDKVIGRKEASGEYGITKEGWIGTVTEINHDGLIWVKGPDLAGIRGTIVDPKFFDLYVDSKDKKIVITTDGRITTARLYDGKTIKKTAEAKCSYADEFDFNVGAAIAMARLLPEFSLNDKFEEKPKFTKKDLKTGMFVLTSNGEWAVVVNDRFIYEDGDFDDMSSINDDFEFLRGRKIDVIVNAVSFDNAKTVIKCDYTRGILYRRSTK